MVVKKLFGVNRICSLLGVSKKTYYQAKAPESRLKHKYQSLQMKVKIVIKAHSSYGVKRIKSDLFRKYQIVIGRDTLGRLLKLWSLDLKRTVGPHPVSGLSKILGYLSDRANILKRTTITAPLQAMTTDMTEILYGRGKMKAYLCIHKDVFGQMIYGFALGLTMEASLVIQSFKMALVTMGSLRTHMSHITDTPSICHQDRGSQYTSYGYTNTVLSSNIRLSYSDPGTPTDNPGQESFFGRFKDEHKHDMYEIDTIEELTKYIRGQTEDYNNERLHTSLNNTPPREFTKKFLSNAGKQYTNQRT